MIRRCRNGDRNAFDQLIDKYQPVVLGTVRKMVLDPEDARDIVQNVFLKAYENLDSFRTEMRFFSWLYRIAINETINFIESSKHRTRIEDETPSASQTPEHEFDRAQLFLKIEAALAQLHPRTRALVVLRHYADLSYRELGFIFDTPEQTIKSRLYGARRVLARNLHEHGVSREDLSRTAG